MAACRHHTTLRPCTCRAGFPCVQERNGVYSKGNKEETNLETVKLIRIQQLIIKRESTANVCDAVFTINGCNQNRTQFSSCTSYGESPWARFSRCVPTTFFLCALQNLVLVGTCYKVATLYLYRAGHLTVSHRQLIHVRSPSTGKSCVVAFSRAV
jgi:hypothetical protein